MSSRLVTLCPVSVANIVKCALLPSLLGLDINMNKMLTAIAISGLLAVDKYVKHPLAYWHKVGLKGSSFFQALSGLIQACNLPHHLCILSG